MTVPNCRKKKEWLQIKAFPTVCGYDSLTTKPLYSYGNEHDNCHANLAVIPSMLGDFLLQITDYSSEHELLLMPDIPLSKSFFMLVWFSSIYKIIFLFYFCGFS